MQNIFSHHNRMKLEINNRRKTEKLTILQRLNNILLNNNDLKKKNKRNQKIVIDKKTYEKQKNSANGETNNYKYLF